VVVVVGVAVVVVEDVLVDVELDVVDVVGVIAQEFTNVQNITFKDGF
jgi:hypothetical protein